MPTAKQLGLSKKKTRPMDLSQVSMEDLDALYIGAADDSPQRIQIANEIDKRVLKANKGKKKKKLSKSEAMETLTESREDLEKGKKVPVGTVSNGRKKVAEGKWVTVREGGRDVKMTRETAKKLGHKLPKEEKKKDDKKKKDPMVTAMVGGKKTRMPASTAKKYGHKLVD